MSIKVYPNTYRKDKEGEVFPDGNHRKEMKYVTGQPIGSDRHALDVLPVGYAYRVENAVAEAGSSNTQIVLTAHGAKRGDCIWFVSTNNSIEEEMVTIDEIIDVNTFRLSAILNLDIVMGDTFHILRPQFQRFGVDGSQIVSISPSPIAFIKDGSPTQVTEDTSDPTNNIPLPVKLTGISGDVNINADNLNLDVQLSDQGPYADAVRIGDGTNRLGVNADNEALVHDADVLAEIEGSNLLLTDIKAAAETVASDGAKEATLQNIKSDIASLDGKDFATETTLAAMAILLATLEGKDFATEDTLSDILDDTAAMDTNISAINTKVATETTLSAVNTAVGGIADASVTNPASSGSVIAFLKGAVSLITSLISKFPASLGQKTSANSLSVTVASDQTPLVTQPGGGSAINVETKTGVTSLADATFSAPPGAFAFYLTCGLDGDGIRWSSFGDVTVSAGAILLPGATTPVMPFGGDIDIIALDGNSEATIVYFMK